MFVIECLTLLVCASVCAATTTGDETTPARASKQVPALEHSLALNGSNDTLSERIILPVDRCVLLIGGYRDGGAPVPLVERYHPTTECAVPQISTENADKTAFTSGCFLPDSQQIVIRDAMDPDKPPMVYPLSGDAATTLPLPYSNYTCGSTAARLDGKTCASCGGWGWDESSDRILTECYAFSDDKWSSLPPLPRPTVYAASVVLGDDYYVIGGYNDDDGYSKEMYRYNTLSTTWHPETPLDDAHTRIAHSAAVLSDTEFIVCGGGEWECFASRLHHLQCDDAAMDQDGGLEPGQRVLLHGRLRRRSVRPGWGGRALSSVGHSGGV